MGIQSSYSKLLLFCAKVLFSPQNCLICTLLFNLKIDNFINQKLDAIVRIKHQGLYRLILKTDKNGSD